MTGGGFGLGSGLGSLKAVRSSPSFEGGSEELRWRLSLGNNDGEFGQHMTIDAVARFYAQGWDG